MHFSQERPHTDHSSGNLWAIFRNNSLIHFYCPSLNANSLDSEDSTKYNDLFSEDPIKILEVTSRMKNVFNKLQELVNSPSEPVYVASSTVNSVSAALSNRADPE